MRLCEGHGDGGLELGAPRREIMSQHCSQCGIHHLFDVLQFPLSSVHPNNTHCIGQHDRGRGRYIPIIQISDHPEMHLSRPMIPPPPFATPRHPRLGNKPIPPRQSLQHHPLPLRRPFRGRSPIREHRLELQRDDCRRQRSAHNVMVMRLVGLDD